MLHLSGCGYRFRAGEASLPDGGQILLIPVAQNETLDVVAGAWLTTALRTEAKRLGLVIAQTQDNAASLETKILSIKSNPRGVTIHGGRYRSQEQEVVAKVLLVLHLASGGKVRIPLSDREGYLSAPDIRGTETNRMVALKRMLGRIAEYGIKRIASVF